jgi:hypothetical protein
MRNERNRSRVPADPMGPLSALASQCAVLQNQRTLQARMAVSIFPLESELGVSELIQLVDKLGRGGRPNSSNTRLLPCLGAPLWGLSMLWNSGKRGRGGAPTVQIMPHSKVAEPRNPNMELAPRVLFCSTFEMQTLSICQRQIRRRTYHPFIDMTSLSDLSNIVRRHGTLVQSGHFAGSPKKRFDCGRIPISTSP